MRAGPEKLYSSRMSLIETGAKAPSFRLDSHLDTKVDSQDLSGQKNILLVFYPLDFTPT